MSRSSILIVVAVLLTFAIVAPSWAKSDPPAPGYGGLEQSTDQQRFEKPAYSLPPTYFDMNAALRLLPSSPALQRVYRVELELLREISALFDRNPNLQQKMSLFIACGVEPAGGGSVKYRPLDRRMNAMMLILSGLTRGSDAEAARLAKAAWAQWREFIRFSRAVVRKVLSDPARNSNLEYYREGARHLSHEDALRVRKELLIDRLEDVAKVAKNVSFTGKIRDWESANAVSQAVIVDQLLPEDQATYDHYRKQSLTYGYSYLPLPLTPDKFAPGAKDEAVQPDPEQSRTGKDFGSVPQRRPNPKAFGGEDPERRRDQTGDIDPIGGSGKSR